MSKAAVTEAVLVRLLIGRNAIKKADLRDLAKAKARAQYSDSLEEALIRSGLVTGQAVAEAYADYLAIPVLRADDGLHDECRRLQGTIPENVCRSRKMLPVALRDGVLEVACLNPTDHVALDEVRFLTGYVVQPVAITLGLFDELMEGLYGDRDMLRELTFEEADDEPEDDPASSPVVDLAAPTGNDREGQVVRLVNLLLSTAIKNGVSDIHLEPYEGSVRVRYRLDGKLQETTPPPKPLFVPVLSCLKVLAKMDIAEKRVPQDGAIAAVYRGSRVDFRVNTCPTVYGEKMVLRILAKDQTSDSMTKLGFSSKQDEDFMRAAHAPHGLVFVTGPTGSGKSTTLYTCLNLINDGEVNISTVEDPVEYRFFGMNQCHVRSKVGMTFATALRAFLRQDPDVIMVGEVRDQETAEICLRAALTGHLVLTTLHTNDSLQAINRLIDMGIEPFLLGPALRLVQAQRLVRSLCAECKVAYEVPARVAQRYGIEPGLTLHRPPDAGGCKACRGTGYKGRIGLFEVVPVGDELRRLIMAKATVGELRDCARRDGVEFLEDAARRAVVEGKTSLEETSELLEQSGGAGD